VANRNSPQRHVWRPRIILARLRYGSPVRRGSVSVVTEVSDPQLPLFLPYYRTRNEDIRSLASLITLIGG